MSELREDVVFGRSRMASRGPGKDVEKGSLGKPDNLARARKDADAGIMWQVEEPLVVEFVKTSKAALSQADGKVRLGKCYQRAGYMVMEDRSWDLVHGTVSIGQFKTADGRGVEVAHAWAELGDVVFDGVQGVFYSKRDYYDKMKAAPEQRYTGKEACEMMLERKTFGPWGPTRGMQR